jgi:hypothetical protein
METIIEGDSMSQHPFTCTARCLAARLAHRASLRFYTPLFCAPTLEERKKKMAVTHNCCSLAPAEHGGGVNL